ncbi:MAG: SMEK domain-containing protein [Chitinophagales bacterium]
MDSRGQYMDNVIRRLSYLQTEITNRNTLNLTALNIHAENFYRDFFNLLGYSFTNTNFSKQNTAHIDLIDNTNKVAMQVTSQNDNEKISSAIKGFFAEPKYQAYKLEVLLISKRAKNYRVDFTSGGQYTFDHKKM